MMRRRTAAFFAAAFTAQRFQVALGELMAEHLAAADLLGRLHVLQTAKQKTGDDLKLNTLSVRFPLHLPAFAAVLGFESVPATGAIRRQRNPTGMTRAAFDRLKQQYTMQAFTIAGVSDVRLIERIQGELVGVLERGGTERDFRNAINALTDDAGMDRLAELHVNTVFQTNVHTAYANGRFEQMKDPAVTAALPYWKYVTVGDGRVRPEHAAMDGFVARHDDPIWRRWYPPAGYNCRCTVVPALKSEAPENADIPGAQRVTAQPDHGFGGHA
jgi:SPP1 gp7 family putative phage head morphogenesis protein